MAEVQIAHRKSNLVLSAPFPSSNDVPVLLLNQPNFVSATQAKKKLTLSVGVPTSTFPSLVVEGEVTTVAPSHCPLFSSLTVWPVEIFKHPTISYISFLKKHAFASVVCNSGNNGPVLLFKNIYRHGNCFLSSIATDGKDGQGWNLKKIGPTFSSFNAAGNARIHQINCINSLF